MAELTIAPLHYRYIIELSCGKRESYDVSAITPSQIFDCALMRIPKYQRPQKYTRPYATIAANVPSGMIGEYSIISQQFVIDTHLDKSKMEETCKEISATHHYCTIKIVHYLGTL